MKRKQTNARKVLCAQEDGTVHSIVTRKGTAKVRAGDYGQKGTEAAVSEKDNRSSVTTEEVVQKRHVRAAGTVVVQSVPHYEDELPVLYRKQKLTGKQRTLYQICIGNHNLFVYNPLKSLESYEKYDIIREGGRLCPFLSCRFPVFVWKKTFREVCAENGRYSPEEAAGILQDRFDYYRLQMRDNGCYDLEGELSVKERNGSFYGKATIIYSRKQTQYR